MLVSLIDGKAQSAGQLAFAANVSPQAASFHLAKLTLAALLKVERQGRNKLYRLAGAEVAGVIESLGAIATPTAVPSPPRVFRSERHQELRFARSCYDHLAGILGVHLHDSILQKGFLLKSSEREYALTDQGQQWLEASGLNTAQTRSPFVRPCMDWSERRPHLAGRLAAQLLEKCFTDGWIARIRETRAVRVTDRGARGFEREYGINLRFATLAASRD